MTDMLDGLLELTAEVSFDPDQADWFDVMEYLDDVPNPRTLLKELVHFLHDEYL